MYNNISRYTEKDIEQILIAELGPRYLEYRNQWNSVTPEYFPKFPIHLDFELNDLCNQRCTMCPRNSDTHPDVPYEVNKKTVLDFELYKKIIDEGVCKGLKSVNLGAFAEPLIHKNVFDMIRYAHDQGVVDSRIITNGMLLNRHYENIFNSGLVNLFVSVDAHSEETYSRIRGKGYELVKNNLMGFLEMRKQRKKKLPIVRVSFIEMKQNRAEKESFIEFWRDQVDMIDIQMYDDFNQSTLLLDRKLPKRWDCRSPWARLAVLSDGNILPCCSFNGWNIPVGHISKDTIEEAWTSQRVASVRHGILDDSLDVCSLCQRGCG